VRDRRLVVGIGILNRHVAILIRGGDGLKRWLHELRVLAGLTRSYGAFALTALAVVNATFYMTLPKDYAAFLLGQAAWLLSMLVGRYASILKGRIETNRLMPVSELYKYYMDRALKPSPFNTAYKALLEKTVLPSDVWVPGFVEEILKGDVFLKPVDGERAWIEALEAIIKPYEDVYARLFKSVGWNEFKLRPIDVVSRNGRTIVAVEPTTYYYSFITNFACDLPMGRGVTLRDVLEPMMLTGNPSEPLRRLGSSRDLPISNHVGVNALIITRDGYLLLPLRSSSVAVEQNVVAHTVAGSLDWKTLTYLARGREEVNLLDLVYQEILEAEEVSTLRPRDYVLYPVAITRNLRVLGKPDFHLIGVVDSPVKDILRHTVTGRKFEVAHVIRLRLADQPLGPSENSKCDLLKVLVEGLAKPLLLGHEVVGEYVRPSGKGGMKTKPARITHRRLSSNLIIGLYAYQRAYEELCKRSE